MIYASVVAVVAVVALTYFGWKLTARSAYESAEYTVLDSAGPFETREYPDLMMATTNTQFESQGDEGTTRPGHQVHFVATRFLFGSNEKVNWPLASKNGTLHLRQRLRYMSLL